MPPQRRAARRQPGESQCMQPACVASRQRLGQMCAARACVQRDFERLEAEIALIRARNGGDGRMNPAARRVEAGGDAATQRENIVILKSRIRAVMALIEKINSAVSASHDPVLKAIEARVASIMEEMSRGDEDPGLVDEYHQLEREASKRRIEKQPLECGICLDAIDPKAHIMGKNCVHVYCPNCINGLALSQVKPGIDEPQRDNNPYWQHAGHREDETINGRSVIHEYTLRPEHLEEDGVTYKTFPANVWVRCPECRDPHFADVGYFGMYKRAMNTLNDSDDLVAIKQPAEVLAEMQQQEVLLFVDAPEAEGYDGPPLVVAVEAKVPGTPPVGDFPKGPTLGGMLRLAGFQLDRKQRTTGNGWVREKSLVLASDLVVHPLDFRGGKLTQTQPQYRKTWVTIPDGPDGTERQEKQKILTGGGFFKFDYPVPPRAIGNNDEAGPSDAGNEPDGVDLLADEAPLDEYDDGLVAPNSQRPRLA